MHRRIVFVAAVSIFAAAAAFQASAYSWYWMAFFASGSTEITDRTARLIAEFHESKKGNCPLKVRLTAHLDAAEALDASSRIDFQRAEAVAERFKRLGTPAWTFEIVVRRDAAPWIRTKPGEAEPQNRRVELTFEDLARGNLECGPVPYGTSLPQRCVVILADGTRCLQGA